MRMVDLIYKKRANQELTTEEINYIIEGYCDGSIPDYQVSSLLMAIYFNPLSDRELFDLTVAMLNSGERIDLSEVNGTTVDKHSTGGVGDKTSLSVLPILAACGLKMAKMSGRGLGHTGGTLDKLESIPGFKIEIPKEDFFKQVNEINLSIIGQSANVCPADKKLYALRDVTATIESIGLISSSIMSKKLASGADNIFLDVKVGSGAFMKDEASATKLAEKMLMIAKRFGVNLCCSLTRMDEPLGNAVGNSLEVIEAIETLKGNGPKDFDYLVRQFSAEALVLTKTIDTMDHALTKVDEVIKNGEALNCLKKMIAYQHGNPDVCDDYSLFKQAKEVIPYIYKGKDAYIESLDALKVGEAAMVLGAGRKEITDAIDHSCGIVLNHKVGDFVKTGEVLAYIYTNVDPSDCIELLDSAYRFINQKLVNPDLIIKTIK